MAREKNISRNAAVFGYQGKIIHDAFLLFRMGDFMNLFTRMPLRLPRFWKLA